MSFCRFVLRFLAAALLFSLPAAALAPAVHHPLDALTPAEYWVVYKAIKDAGHTEEKTIFSSVLLHEPEKQYVLAGSRDRQSSAKRMWCFITRATRMQRW